MIPCISKRVTLQLYSSLKSNAALQISEYFMNQYHQKQLLIVDFNADTFEISQTTDKSGPDLLVTFIADYKNLSGTEEVQMHPLDAQARQNVSSSLAGRINTYLMTI